MRCSHSQSTHESIHPSIILSTAQSMDCSHSQSSSPFIRALPHSVAVLEFWVCGHLQIFLVNVPATLQPGQEFCVEAPRPRPIASHHAEVVDRRVVPPVLEVTLPAGVFPGQSLLVSAPDGRRMSITVPAGMGSGSVLEVELPDEYVHQQDNVQNSLQRGSSTSFRSQPNMDPVNGPGATVAVPQPPFPTQQGPSRGGYLNQIVLPSPRPSPTASAANAFINTFHSPRRVPATQTSESVLVGGQHFKLAGAPHPLQSATMAVQMRAAQDYWFARHVKKFRIGLSWDAECDVDTSAAMFDATQRLVDVVSFRKLKSTCGSITHSGDDICGEGDGDDEVLSIHLRKIPQPVSHLLFFVCVYQEGLSLDHVNNCCVSVRHEKKRQRKGERRPLLFQYKLNHSTIGNASAVVLCMLTRVGAFFKMSTVCTPLTGHTLQKMLLAPNIPKLLSSSPPIANALRSISVQVIGAKRLFPHDHHGGADPYAVIRFRKAKFKTKHCKNTLNPVFNSPPVVLGAVDAAESRSLEIFIFDKDTFSHDDFMGGIQIPGSALFALGPGTHPLNIELDTKQYARRKKFKGKAYGRQAYAGTVEFFVTVRNLPPAF
eukprot:INCI16439.3.p1 GENE.INCI16439.3~~INCI16439.3.p1  ORF type:complete len:600 (-),score=86.36 INCI16439.3:1393-3192(-)